MARYENVVAVILGGGAGTRLFPLTKDRAKPAVPLAGKYRLIDVPISNCINSGVSQIFVLTQFNSASLNRHVSRTYRFSSFSTGFVEVLAAEQTKDSPEWFQGTADAVRQTLRHLRGWQVDTVLILSGDHLYRMNYQKFLDRHFATKADVTVSVIPCKQQDAEGFGILKTDEQGRIRQFKEKPKGEALEEMRVDTTAFGVSASQAADHPYLASMGIYVFDYKKLVALLEKYETAVDFGGEIIPNSLEDHNVQAHIFNDYWEDIGTIRSFYEANLDLGSPLPKFNFFDAEAPIYTRSRYLPPTKAHDCSVYNSMVSEGCILNGVSASRSIIGLRSRIDRNTKIENSIIMGADFYESIDEIEANIARSVPHIGIGENCIIRKAIIDKNVRIGNNVRLINQNGLETFDDANGCFYIREGIIIVPKNSTIPNDTVV